MAWLSGRAAPGNAAPGGGAAGGGANRRESAIHEPPHCPGSIFVNALKQARLVRMRLVVRKRPTLKIVRHALPPIGGIDRCEAFGQRLRGSIAAQLQYLLPLQEQLDGPSKTRPELYLPRDGSLHNFAREPGIQNERVGELHWLTHGQRVA